MKKTFLVVFLLLLTMVLSSCNGYNKIMYNHLSDPQNYVSATGTIKNIYFFDADGTKTFWENSTNEIPLIDYTMYISIQFDTQEDYLLFAGVLSLPEGYDYQANNFNFEIINSNVDILIETGFFEYISIDEEVTILTSNWIYMDGDFFEIIELSFNNTIYLNSEDGLANFIKFMDENKSLF